MSKIKTAEALPLHVDISGQGEPLIMLHGMFGSYENLGAIARILENHYTLYRVDLRNHGRSPHADTMSFSEMAGDVRALIEKENIAPVNIFGHSLGGKVAMQLAFESPALLKKIIVADIAPVSYPSHHNAILDALQAIDPQQIKSRSEADKLLQPFVSEMPVRQFILKSLARNEDGQFFWRINVPAVVENYDSLRLSVGDGQVCDIPTLFLRGEHSKYIQERNLEEIHQKFSNAKVTLIKNASHWLHAEQPEAVAEAVNIFLQH